MKKLSVIALTLLTAGAAMAGGLSREEVRAELLRARAAGEIELLSRESPNPVPSAVVSPTTRAAGLAELDRARKAGELEGQYGEADRVIKPLASTRTRAEVLAELAAARASGELELLNSNDPEAVLLRLQAKQVQSAELLAGQPKAAH